MHVHRFEKVWLGAALVLIVAFIGTIVYGAVGPGVGMVTDDGGTIDAEAVSNGAYDTTDNFREPGVYTSGEGVDVYVVARQFLFEPGTGEPIRVPAGQPVTFHITSADVTHGFNLAGTNVNTMVIPGQVAEFTVTFDDPAEYGIVCHEYCGAAHHEMAGQLVVVPASQYDQQAAASADAEGDS